MLHKRDKIEQFRKQHQGQEREARLLAKATGHDENDRDEEQTGTHCVLPPGAPLADATAAKEARVGVEAHQT
eukprot:CAMPEP_0170637956 /NCGR_PEP_ID=MMETSP0224-20130122/38741_1 /TAXON_ID=285029 /ORGANISM="Togula jolla, Strain CCCM 725" /LENGTH=71 /DNA_ID=CAMNT_0010967977 /DNA_START=374 /DNA_END=589 /DNA_ORIENTATION=+